MATQEKKKFVILDAEGKYLQGVITDKDSLEQDEGVELLPEYTFFEVDRFPQADEFWDPQSQSWIVDEEKREELEDRRKKKEFDKQTPRQLHALITKEVQKLVRRSLKAAGIKLTAEQEAELFPLSGDEQ